MIKNKYSVLSVDSNPDYLFFVPMACAFWKEINYQPFVILVDTGIEPELKELVFSETEKVGGHIKIIEHIDGYRTCNVAQISRLYAAADPYFNDDDYLMTDDMDKFVIDYMWFNQQNSNKDIHIYDPDELNYRRLKIGNIGMKASVWKEVIGIHDGTLRDNVRTCFDKHLSQDSDWNTGWNLERGGTRWGTRNGRICRSAWSQTFNECMSTKLIDIHLHRDPYVGRVWEDTVTIMRRIFPESKVREFINYKEKFVELIDE